MPDRTQVQRTIGNVGFRLAQALVLCLLIVPLLPSIQIARPAARKAACQSNLKQLANAFALYAEDNGGLVPPYQNRLDAHWSPPDGGATGPIPEQGAPLVAALNPYVKNPEAWFCHEDRDARTGSTVGGVRHQLTSYRTGSTLSFSRTGTPLPMKLKVKDAHLRVLLTDNLWGCDYTRDSWWPAPATSKWPYSHQGRYNYAYFDGHVRSITKKAPECIEP